MRQMLAGRSPEAASLAAEVAAGYLEYGLRFDVAFLMARLHRSRRVVEIVRGNAPLPILRRGEVLQPVRVPPGNPFSSSLPRRTSHRYAAIEHQLEPGDSLYVFTDGCFEFMAGPDHVAPSAGRGMSGWERLLPLIQQTRGDGGIDGLLESLRLANGGEQFEDDLTMLRLTLRPIEPTAG
jgi:hypothetical protein